MLHKCHYQHFEGSLLWKQFRHHRPSRSISSLRISSSSILTSFALASTKIHSLHQHCPKTSKYSLKFDSFTLFTSADLILLGALINESAFVTMIDVPSCFLTFSLLPTATIPRSWEFLKGGDTRTYNIYRDNFWLWEITSGILLAQMKSTVRWSFRFIQPSSAN